MIDKTCFYPYFMSQGSKRLCLLCFVVHRKRKTERKCAIAPNEAEAKPCYCSTVSRNMSRQTNHANVLYLSLLENFFFYSLGSVWSYSVFLRFIKETSHLTYLNRTSRHHLKLSLDVFLWKNASQCLNFVGSPQIVKLPLGLHFG